ncbi:MAG: 3-phosphoshikimate 1-carboxyvinyltransferase, partial [Devosia sp.]|nr:3-phosphoshikimate 1-carboxyvinyltransferase [Devosia sp.]
LAANGATARADRGGLHVGRPTEGVRLGGGRIAAGDNPHVAAAFLIFGLAAAEQVTLDDDGPMQAAFPDLMTGLETLGAEFYRSWAA